MSDTFDLFDATCKQHLRTALNLFSNGAKNGGIDGTCKQAFNDGIFVDARRFNFRTYLINVVTCESYFAKINHPRCFGTKKYISCFFSFRRIDSFVPDVGFWQKGKDLRLCYVQDIMDLEAFGSCIISTH